MTLLNGSFLIRSIFRSISGRPLASFLGIPYGKSERFQRPQKAEKWEGVFVADRHIQCAQVRVVYAFMRETFFEITYYLA